jgi:hypothetical protein
MGSTVTTEIAVQAARLVVEEGLDYGAAKRRAARDVRLQGGGTPELPDNETVEDEVRAYIELFHAETQPGELAELRATAVVWMERLADFRPHLTGAVWRGTATRQSDIHIDLFCDDSKAAEIALIDRGVEYDVVPGEGRDAADVLVVHERASGGPRRGIALHVHDYDDLRGALRRDARGRPWRGDLAATRAAIAAAADDGAAGHEAARNARARRGGAVGRRCRCRHGLAAKTRT